MYQLRRPAADLQPFVEHYWFVTHPDDEPVTLRVDVYVDARADLIINHGVSYRREIVGGRAEQIDRSNLDAQRLEPIRIAQHGLVDIAGVRFRLGGLGPFVRSPLAEFTGRTPDAAAVFDMDATALEGALAETPDLDAKAALLDAFLLSRLDTGGRFPQFAASLAVLERGGHPVLSASERRDRARLFARYLGIPPQTLTRIVRFQTALRSLMSDPEGSLGELASQCGYFDQAHFIREFRQMTGGVPRGYRGYYPLDGPADFAPNVVAYVQDARPFHSGP
jgi:AraC-like DNA-binding protein